MQKKILTNGHFHVTPNGHDCSLMLSHMILLTSLSPRPAPSCPLSGDLEWKDTRNERCLLPLAGWHRVPSLRAAPAM